METLSLKVLILLFCKVRQTGNWSSFCFKTVFQPFSGKLVPLGCIFVGVFLFFFPYKKQCICFHIAEDMIPDSEKRVCLAKMSLVTEVRSGKQQGVWLVLNMNKVNGCKYSEQAVEGEMEVGRERELREESQVCDSFLPPFFFFLSFFFPGQPVSFFVVIPLSCSR